MKRKNFMYYLKQKLYGSSLIIIGLIIPFINDGDATASLLLVPLGLYTLFTKNYVLWEDDEL